MQHHINADWLIERFGDQAYHYGVQLTVIAVQSNDIEYARLYAAATRELMLRGYHKHPKTAP